MGLRKVLLKYKIYFVEGIIVSAGISNLQMVDMLSSRNMFVVGFSMGVGVGIPGWINENPTAISTGRFYIKLLLKIFEHIYYTKPPKCVDIIRHTS